MMGHPAHLPPRIRYLSIRIETKMPYKSLEQRRKWYAEHAESCRMAARNWHRRHATEQNIASHQWRIENPERAKAYDVARRVERRAQVLAHYGARCACCGENTPEFLSIDHIAGNGAAHRKEIGEGSRLYAWLIKNNFPEGFQLLCYNCNHAKGHRGECPHNKKAITWDATGFHLALVPLQKGANL
jgi:hypothetical protein